MPVTTKTVLFIGENLITSCSYESNPKKSIKGFEKFARSFHKKSKKDGLSDGDIAQYLLSAIHHNSVQPSQNKVLLDHVAAFRDFNEQNCDLKAEVAIVFVAIIGIEITGIAFPWDITRDRFDELNKSDIQMFYMMGLEALTVKLHDMGKLGLVKKMRECNAKHELIKISAVHGWADLNENCNMEYTSIRVPIDGSAPSIVGVSTGENSSYKDCGHDDNNQTEKTIVLLNEFIIDKFTYKSNSQASATRELNGYIDHQKLEREPGAVSKFNDFMAKAIQATIRMNEPIEEIRKLVGVYVDLTASYLNESWPLYIVMISGYTDCAARGIVAPSPYNEFNLEKHTDDEMALFLHIAHVHLVMWISENNVVPLIHNMNECKLKTNLVAALDAFRRSNPE